MSEPQNQPNETATPEPETKLLTGTTIASSATSSEPEPDWESIRTPEELAAADEEVELEAIAAEEHDSQFMSADKFYETIFKGTFDMAGGMTRLEAYPIQPHEEKGARASSDMLYRASKRLPWLNWLAHNDTERFTEYFLVCGFVVGKLRAVKEEVAARRQEEGGEEEAQPGDLPEPKRRDEKREGFIEVEA